MIDDRMTAPTITCGFGNSSPSFLFPKPNFSYDISGKLLEKGAKGTFFFNGNNCTSALWIYRVMGGVLTQIPRTCLDECIYDDAEIARVKYVVAHGHQVASHTWAHLVSWRRFRGLLEKTDHLS